MNESAQPVATQANQPTESETVSDNFAVDDNASVENESESIENTEPFLKVKYNKKETGLSHDEAKTYAQKGMNYDKILGRLNDANAKLKRYESGSEKQTSNSGRQSTVNKQLSEFLNSNPGVDPNKLPSDVLKAWKRGVPLSEAAASYQAHKYQSEVNELKKQIMQLKTNESNSHASMGRPSSNGSAMQKPLTVESIKKMSRKEIDKNIDRIWEFLTGVKKTKK